MKKIFLLIILLLSLLTINLTYAYPPDNAAVLYYKHMEHFTGPDEALGDQIYELPTSAEPASKEVKEFIEKQKKNHLIPELVIASELEHCDWGLDFSQGFEMLMPGLSHMRQFHYLLLADSAIQASEGDINAALKKNLVVRRMGHHVTNDTLIGFLVSFSINRRSDEALGHLLSTYPVDEKTLVELKNELLWESYRPKPIRHPLMMEKEVCLNELSKITPERYKNLVADWEKHKNSEKLIKLLEKNDPTFLDRSTAYLEKYYDKVFAIMEKPYTQAYPEIGIELKKASEDIASGNDAAVFADVFCPAGLYTAFARIMPPGVSTRNALFRWGLTDHPHLRRCDGVGNLFAHSPRKIMGYLQHTLQERARHHRICSRRHGTLAHPHPSRCGCRLRLRLR